MKPEWMPKTREEALAYLVEECGEVLQVVGKIGRFVIDNAHPDALNVTNRELLFYELCDLEYAIKLARDAYPSTPLYGDQEHG